MNSVFKKILFVMILSSISAIVSAQQQEEITFTTYYPSPYGSFVELRAVSTSVGSGYQGSDPGENNMIVEGNVRVGEPATFSSAVINKIAADPSPSPMGLLDIWDARLTSVNRWLSEGGTGELVPALTMQVCETSAAPLTDPGHCGDPSHDALQGRDEVPFTVCYLSGFGIQSNTGCKGERVVGVYLEEDPNDGISRWYTYVSNACTSSGGNPSAPLGAWVTCLK
jgi:hypothetical protein